MTIPVISSPESRALPERVLITGGSGMLGSHVVDRLADLGVPEVVVVNRTINWDNLSRSRGRVRITAIEADVRDHAAVTAAMDGCQAVVHLAAMLMNASTTDPRAAFEINVAGTHSLLWEATQRGIERFVFGSSIGVYGSPTSADVITEASPINARTFYGTAKYASELFCRAFNASFGLDYIALRFGTLYGDRQPSGGRYPGQLLTLIDRRDDHRVDVEGDPGELHDFLYAGDAAQAVALALTRDVEDVAVNIVSGVPVTWEQVVATLLEAAGSSAQVQWHSRPAAASSRRFDPSVARELLGFEPQTTLAEGMRRLVEWRTRGRD